MLGSTMCGKLLNSSDKSEDESAMGSVWTVVSTDYNHMGLP